MSKQLDLDMESFIHGGIALRNFVGGNVFQPDVEAQR